MKVIGEVASAASRNGQFGHRPATGLKNRYGLLRCHTPKQRGAKAPRCPGSYDGYTRHSYGMVVKERISLS